MQVFINKNELKLKINGNTYELDSDIIKYLIRHYSYSHFESQELLNENGYKYSNTGDDLIKAKLSKIKSDYINETVDEMEGKNE